MQINTGDQHETLEIELEEGRALKMYLGNNRRCYNVEKV